MGGDTSYCLTCLHKNADFILNLTTEGVQSGHYHLRGPALLLPRTRIFTSGTCIIAFGPAFSHPGPALSLQGPALLLPDLHYVTVTFPSRKLKQMKGNQPNWQNH